MPTSGIGGRKSTARMGPGDLPGLSWTDHRPCLGPRSARRMVIVSFDWMTWRRTDEGQALRDRPEAVETASDQLAMLLTAIVRSDGSSRGRSPERSIRSPVADRETAAAVIDEMDP